MKRFIVSVLCVSVFCIGVGALVEKVGASLKSDEKGLALIRQARLAIGGDQSIAAIRAMIIKGNTINTFKFDGASRTEQGETEIAMQLPDKLSKVVRIGRHDGSEGAKIIDKQHDVIVMRGDAPDASGEKRIVMTKVEDGHGDIEQIGAESKASEYTAADGKRIVVRKADGADVENIVLHGKGERMAERSGHRQNELLRTMLALLLTAPDGMDVSYTFAGEGDVDGTACNIVNAEFAGSTVKLYLSKASSFPVMVSYIGHAIPRFMAFKAKAPEGAEPHADKVVTFSHKIEAPQAAEVQIRFADYRSVNGVQLPYKWTTSVAGQTTEVLDVTSYEINPPNIAEKFQNQKVLVRAKTKAN